MVGKLRKMKLKTALYMGICFYSLSMLIHVLIISSIIPYTWVNGGRSDSFAAQFSISIMNMFICIIGLVFTIKIGGNKLYKYNKVMTVISCFFVILWSFGFLQQLVRTTFEKTVCSLLLLLGVVSHLRMSIE
ncbi:MULTISPECIES: hypothetical protein [Bacillaceae]|uniref:hypothetical protein n=1 Tax=Bacillaceae TaxID=186817 RepID=UPI000BFB760C|nr:MULTISPECIES: hypothetical protein [Bacillaceae]PGT82756.1 hypothetical protein COD11_14125 [Bacillus sp. AFS040349]UGB33088.1 hypothetical protein LPC09_12005 [Metabacillus sp. B2-18]